VPSKWTRTKPRTKGICKVCGKEIYLGSDGKIWFHYETKPPVHVADPK